VLFLYTTQAIAIFGNENALKAEITKAVEATNKVFENSRLQQRLTVKAASIEKAPASFTQSASFGYDLDVITNNRDIAARRDHASVRADIVSLIRGEGNMWGIAWGLGALSPTYARLAFNVVYATKVADGLVCAHELGHNLGGA
jgi:Metallo-peptidase family M12B Reprolysin-like